MSVVEGVKCGCLELESSNHFLMQPVSFLLMKPSLPYLSIAKLQITVGSSKAPLAREFKEVWNYCVGLVVSQRRPNR